MNPALILAVELGGWLPTFPSFDWIAAYVVGGIVAVGAIGVIWLAIASPFVAIQRGASLSGTVVAVTFIGLLTGVIAAAAAGVYWGRQGDLKRAEIVQKVARVGNQLDIYFDAEPGTTGAAKSNQATIVRYDEEGLGTKAPGVSVKKRVIKAPDGLEFRDELRRELRDWVEHRRQVGGDARPRVHVFTKPNPGQAIQDELRDLCREYGCVLETTESDWVSALDR